MLKNMILPLVAFVCFQTNAAKSAKIINNIDFSNGFKGWYVSNKNTFSVKDIAGKKVLEIKGAKSPKLNSYCKCTQNLNLSKDQLQGKKFVFGANINAIKLSGRFDVAIREIDAKGKSVLYHTIKLTKWDSGEHKNFKLAFTPNSKTVKLAFYIVGYYLSPDDKILLQDSFIKIK